MDKMSEVEIRPATPQDAAAIAALIVDMQRHYGAPHPPPPDIEAQLRGLAPGVEMLVAIREGRMAGLAAYATLYPGPGLMAGLFLKELYVASDHRSFGVGHALMKALAGIVETRGLGRIDWTVGKDNLRALAFYDAPGGDALPDRHFYRLSGSALAALAGG